MTLQGGLVRAREGCKVRPARRALTELALTALIVEARIVCETSEIRPDGKHSNYRPRREAFVTSGIRV